ncbi:MAG TPA: hypothetical protein PK299_06090 [Anaerolineales bacterium]|nr:hypothetical protein [Anaerolineales bacterium]
MHIQDNPEPDLYEPIRQLRQESTDALENLLSEESPAVPLSKPVAVETQTLEQFLAGEPGTPVPPPVPEWQSAPAMPETPAEPAPTPEPENSPHSLAAESDTPSRPPFEMEFRPRYTGWFLRLLLWSIVTGIGVFTFWTVYRNQDLAFLERYRWFLAIGPVVALIGFNGLWATLQWAGAWAKIDERGIDYRVLWNRYRYAWQDLKEVWQQGEQSHQSARFLFSVLSNDERRFTLAPILQDDQRLGRILQDRVLRHRYPAAVQALEQGEEVSFGLLKLSKDAVSWSKKRISWQELAFVELKEAYLKFWRKGEKKPVWVLHIVDVPNVFVLLSLLEQLLADGVRVERLA